MRHRCAPAMPLPPSHQGLGLLWASRPRSLIPRGLADLAAGSAHQPLANPGRDADSRQAGRLAD